LNLKYIYPSKVLRTPSNRPQPSLHFICEIHVIYIL